MSHSLVRRGAFSALFLTALLAAVANNRTRMSMEAKPQQLRQQLMTTLQAAGVSSWSIVAKESSALHNVIRFELPGCDKPFHAMVSRIGLRFEEVLRSASKLAREDQQIFTVFLGKTKRGSGFFSFQFASMMVQIKQTFFETQYRHIKFSLAVLAPTACTFGDREDWVGFWLAN